MIIMIVVMLNINENIFVTVRCVLNFIMAVGVGSVT